MEWEYRDEYIVMHPRGKLLSDKTKSRLTTNFHEAVVGTYEGIIGFCQETYADRRIVYSIHHVDVFENDGKYGFCMNCGVNINNLTRIFKSIDENHYMLEALKTIKY